MLGITQSFLVETGNWELQYEMEKALNNITVAGSRSEIYKILMSALSDGDYDAYKAIVADMIDEGVKASAIEQGVRSAIAKYTEKHKGFTIPAEAKALLGLSAVFQEDAKKDDTFGPEDLGGEAYVRYSEMKADDYSAIESELRESARFNRLSNDDKNRALDFAEKIAKDFALESASAGRYTVTTKWISKADDAQRIGISIGEYILFHMAYNDASGENKREIVRDWLVQNSALSESQRDFLWSTVYSSEF